MNERKVRCPETGHDCASAECSIRICVRYQERIFIEQRMAEWEADRRRANRDVAAWRAFCDLIAEHNSLIDANKLGVATDVNGNIITKRLRFPNRGRGSKIFRRKIVERILTSTKADTVARFHNAMNAILTEERAATSLRNQRSSLAQRS
jgi:hypothetical protein